MDTFIFKSNIVIIYIVKIFLLPINFFFYNIFLNVTLDIYLRIYFFFIKNNNIHFFLHM